MGLQKKFVLGIDGMPYSLLNEMFLKGEMPNLRSICKGAGLKRMKSVYPVISSVAWTSYATGKNPAQHNIFGFVDRNTRPFNIFIPTTKNRMTETIWTKLSAEGKKVIVINVPMTYPPENVNGKMVSCFLCTNIEKSTYPPELYRYLKEKEYIIDVDAWLAQKDLGEFLDELLLAMRKRFEVCFELMDQEKWDFFQLHIMETDRLMHFMWDDVMCVSNTIYSDRVAGFFRELDAYVGELYQRLPKDAGLVILSDHGFCGIKYEVQLNKWLEQEGLLMFEDGTEKQLSNYNSESLCYSLLPGRVFINLEGREEKGCVKKEEYNNVREKIKEKLLALTNPYNNEKVIDKVFYREDIYKGPYMDRAADIIAHPVDGYDLKGRLDSREVFTRTHLTGMHTYNDAVIIGVGIDVSGVDSIIDVADVIIKGE